MRGGAVSSREALAGDDECSCVGAEVEEELSDDIDTEHSLGLDVMVVETPDQEEDSKDGEAHVLNWLAANSVDGGNTEPIARNCASTNICVSFGLLVRY